jgi:hypothetical protein
VISLNLVLAGLRLGLKNRQVGEKWVSDDCSYFCLNIVSVVLCNISVNQQSFLKSKYLVSIRTNIDDSLAF